MGACDGVCALCVCVCVCVCDIFKNVQDVWCKKVCVCVCLCICVLSLGLFVCWKVLKGCQGGCFFKAF